MTGTFTSYSQTSLSSWLFLGPEKVLREPAAPHAWRRVESQTAGLEGLSVTQCCSDRGNLRPRWEGFDLDQGLLPPASPAAREWGPEATISLPYARVLPVFGLLCGCSEQTQSGAEGCPSGGWGTGGGGTCMRVSSRGQKQPHHLRRICREETAECTALCGGPSLPWAVGSKWQVRDVGGGLCDHPPAPTSELQVWRQLQAGPWHAPPSR